MVKNITTDVGSDYIRLTWAKPKYLPDKYILLYNCTFVCTTILYASDEISENGNRTSMTLDHLIPATECKMYFFASYHPNSLDEGVEFFLETLPSSELTN